MLTWDYEAKEAADKLEIHYGAMTVLHPLNPKYPDIEIKKSVHYHIVGKIVEKKRC